MNEPVLKIEEARKILGIGLSQIYTLLKEKKIPGFKLGHVWKIPVKAFNDWLWYSATNDLDQEVKAGMTAARGIKERVEKVESQNRSRHLEWDEATKQFTTVEETKNG